MSVAVVEFDDSHLTDDPQPSGLVYDKFLGRRVPVDAASDPLAEMLDDDHLTVSSVGNYTDDRDRRSDVEAKAARFYARYLKVDPDEQLCARMQAILDRHSTGARKDMVDGHYAAVCSSMAGHAGLAATLRALSEMRDGANGHERDVRRSIEGAYKRAMTHRDKTELACACPGTFEVVRPAKPAPEAIDNPDDEIAEESVFPRLIADLEPYLSGTVETEPTVRGARRSDDVPLLYAGRDHTAIGETEAGKSWLALACAIAELQAGRRVLYLHFEEPDPRTTVLRFRQMGVAHLLASGAFAFAGIDMPILRPEHLGELIDHKADLVILDGVNAAMTLHGWDTNGADGVGVYRAKLVAPFLATGASVLALDHVVKNPEQRGNGYAMGSAMKLNMVSGASFLMENREPLRPGAVGETSIYVVKDRPGSLREVSMVKTSGRRALFGTMRVDSTTALTEVRLTRPGVDPAAEATEDDLAPVSTKALKVLAAVARLNGEATREKPPTVKEVRRGKPGVAATDVPSFLDTLEAHGLVEKETGDGPERWLLTTPGKRALLAPGEVLAEDFQSS